jgi:hypothetical protein
MHGRGLLCIIFLAVAVLAAAEDPPVVRVRLVDGGANAEPVPAELVVTAEKRRIFHHRADFTGGGIWCEASIWLADGSVNLASSQSVSTPFGPGGSQVKTESVIFRLPVNALAGQVVDLWLGNKVVFGASPGPGDPPLVPPPSP